MCKAFSSHNLFLVLLLLLVLLTCIGNEVVELPWMSTIPLPHALVVGLQINNVPALR